jgi:hypothetical protein
MLQRDSGRDTSDHEREAHDQRHQTLRRKAGRNTIHDHELVAATRAGNWIF